MGTAGTQESQSILLAARSTYHLLIGLWPFPGRLRREGQSGSVKLGDNYSILPVQEELGRVRGETEESPMLFLFQIIRGAWAHSDSALQVTCSQQAVEWPALRVSTLHA